LADSTSEIKLVISGNAESAERTISNVSKLLADMSESMTRMAQRFVDAGKVLTEFGSTIARTGEDVSMASSRLTRLGSNVARQAERISTGAGDIVKSLDAVPKAAEEAALSAARSFAQFNDAQSGAASLVNATTERIKAETDALRAQTEATKAAAASTRQYGHDQMLSLIGLQILGDQISRIADRGLELFAGAITSAADFQASMDRVKAALMSTGGATEENIQKLGQVAQKLDQTTIFSANEITDALQDLAKQGITFGDLYGDGIHNAIAATTTLAQATDTDLRSTATVIGDVMNEFAIKGKDMVNVVNSISGAMHVSRISMEDFYNAMKYAGPQAHNLGMDVRDVAAAIGLLAERGIKGSQAGTTLRRMFLNLEPHTKAATEEFKKLGLITKDGSNIFFDASGHVKSMGEVIEILRSHLEGLNPVQRQQALNTIFGTYALSGMTVIASTTREQWDKLTKAMGETNAQDVAAAKIDNVKGHIEILRSTMTTLGTQFASFLLPAVDKVVNGLTRLANWFQNLNPHAQHVMFITFGIGAALLALGATVLTTAATIAFILPGLQLLGTAFRAVGSSLSFLLGPWGLLIAAVVAGVALLITHWTQVNNWMQQHFGVTIPGILRALLGVFTNVFDGIKSVAQAVWGFVGPYIIGAVQKVAAYWKSIWPELKDVFGGFWNLIKAIMTPIIAWWGAEFNLIATVVKAIWKPLWDTLVSILRFSWDAMTGIIRTSWDIISGIFKVILDVLTGRWSDAWKDIKSTLRNVWSDITGMFSNMLNDALSFGENFVKMIGNGIMAGVHWVENAVNTVANKIKSFLGFHSPTEEGPGAEADQWAPNFMKMYEQGIEQNLPKLQSSLTVALETPFRSMTSQMMAGNGLGRIGQTPSYSGLGRTGGGRVVQFNGPITINAPQAKDARGIAQALKQQFSIVLS
jgi:TP901 family phage tail tape measure protein